MAVTVSGTSITFNNATVQTSAALTGPKFQAFTSSGTFTVPNGVTSLAVKVWGAGAGGRGAFQTSGGGVGGSGGFGEAYITGLTPGASITVTVGTGGNGSTGNVNASNGGTSSFGTYLSCTGGSIVAAASGTPTFSGATVLQRFMTFSQINGATSGANAPGTPYVCGCPPSPAYPGGGGGGAGFSGGGGGGASWNGGGSGSAGLANGPGNNGVAGSAAVGSNGGAGGAGGSPGGTGGGSGVFTSGGGGGGGGGVLVQW